MLAKRSLRWLTAAGFVGLLGGCGGSPPPPPPPPPAPPARAPSAPTALPKAPELPPLAPKAYEVKGRRDPFRSLGGATEGPKGLTVASVKLVGIIQGRGGPLALVETPDGLGYILRTGDLIGDGKLLEIGSDSVTFNVTSRPGEAPRRVVLRFKED